MYYPTVTIYINDQPPTLLSVFPNEGKLEKQGSVYLPLRARMVDTYGIIRSSAQTAILLLVDGQIHGLYCKGQLRNISGSFVQRDILQR